MSQIQARQTTVRDLQTKKERGEPITILTAYDYPTARLVDEAGIDAILVGDSLGMVVLGHDSTLPVTMDDMLRHAQAVRRGTHRALLIGDMPFMSYQIGPEQALLNAGRFLSEGGMHCVKLEGGRHVAPTVHALVKAGIPVQGHIGLMPQSVNQVGGYRAQGTTAQAAYELLEDALQLEQAGCFSIVLESVPDRVADHISRRLHIPTIGIGAGPGCDGQVLVFHDLVGWYDGFSPRFVKRYADLRSEVARALGEFKADVESRTFPADEHCFHISDQEWSAFVDKAGAPPRLRVVG
jgi:3-methyl-2-oxobutanoate hydroxymethyltransferase